MLSTTIAAVCSAVMHAKNGQYASEKSVAAEARRFSRELEKPIMPSLPQQLHNDPFITFSQLFANSCFPNVLVHMILAYAAWTFVSSSSMQFFVWSTVAH